MEVFVFVELGDRMLANWYSDGRASYYYYTNGLDTKFIYVGAGKWHTTTNHSNRIVLSNWTATPCAR